ncbi:helix-turn-helix domain-containing protein [Megamonas hypermegale]|nr:helix-turn-helix domain-containing protein [Megamonas hypermegale]
MLEIKINLREIRKQKGLTQKELAKFSNVLGYSEERTEKDMQEAEDKQR